MNENEEKLDQHQFELEKLKLKIGIGKWFLGSFVITLISLFINSSLQDRNQGLLEIKQYETHVEMITNVDNIAKRRLLAQFFSNVTASKKLKEGWQSYYAIVDKEYHVFIDSLQKSISKYDSSNTPQGKIQSSQFKRIINDLNSVNIQSSIASSSNPSHAIYFQVTDKSLRNLSDSLVLTLNLIGFKAYGTEFVSTQLNDNRIVYYRNSDLDLANDLKHKLESMGLKTELVFLGRLSNKTKPGTIEVWIVKEFKLKKFDQTFDDTFN